MDFMTAASLTALAQVILIDLVLAGDNAVVIALAAAGLEKSQRHRAIVIGILVATVLRVIFAGLATQLMAIIGLTLAGGLLLLWVCWKMWRELRDTAPDAEGTSGESGTEAPRKTLAQAVRHIVIADVSMSLDNVLAVAGAARDHLWVLTLGLIISVGLMGLAANLIANLLQRNRWIAYAGLAIILFVALRMIYDGMAQVAPAVL